MGRTIVRVRGTDGTDGNGDPILDWAHPSRLDIPGCVVAPRVSADLDQPGRQAIVEGLTVFAPPAADIVARDRVEIDDDHYEIDGEIAMWTNPFTDVARGVQFDLTRTEG